MKGESDPKKTKVVSSVRKVMPTRIVKLYYASLLDKVKGENAEKCVSIRQCAVAHLRGYYGYGKSTSNGLNCFTTLLTYQI